MPSATQIDLAPEFAKAERVQRFWDEHFRELLLLYPDQFVAVANGVVVETSPDLAMLIYQLRDRGLSPGSDADIEYISAKSASLLL